MLATMLWRHRCRNITTNISPARVCPQPRSGANKTQTERLPETTSKNVFCWPAVQPLIPTPVQDMYLCWFVGEPHAMLEAKANDLVLFWNSRAVRHSSGQATILRWTRLEANAGLWHMVAFNINMVPLHPRCCTSLFFAYHICISCSY